MTDAEKRLRYAVEAAKFADYGESFSVRDRDGCVEASVDTADLCALLNEVTRLREDAARLDWLERAEAETLFTGDECGQWCVRFGKISVSTMQKSQRSDAETLREAIDIARSAEGAR